MSPKGVQMVHNVLGGALRHAVKMELISRNPVASVSPPPLEKKEAFSPVVASVRRLLAHAEADGTTFGRVCISSPIPASDEGKSLRLSGQG